MHTRRSYSSARGFTLIEILVVIGMISILAGAVLVAVNPLRQFAQARNAKRVTDVSAILNAISNRIADNDGQFEKTGDTSCGTDILQLSQPMTMSSDGGTSDVDVRPCLVPNYIPEMPTDPKVGTNTCTTDSCTGNSYATGYTVSVTDSHRITVCAPESVSDGTAAPYCLTR